jgi:hypothetical protein
MVEERLLRRPRHIWEDSTVGIVQKCDGGCGLVLSVSASEIVAVPLDATN